VIRVAPDLTRTTIAMGGDAAAANGVVYDPDRGLLFYTKYQAGQMRRVAIDEQGDPGAPELVVEIPATSLDGLVMDACGYLYVVNQGGDELYRVLLDAAGASTDQPSPIALFPSNVANAQFGVGAGFDDHTLYVAGNPGDCTRFRSSSRGRRSPRRDTEKPKARGCGASVRVESRDAARGCGLRFC
jgi:sugar lactone lactonase YvrE